MGAKNVRVWAYHIQAMRGVVVPHPDNDSPNNESSDNETGPIPASPRPGMSETWSTMHVLALDATKLSGQAQTASLPMGKGTSKIYSTGDIVDGSYRLLSLLGSGGMGIVFHCQHMILGKEYALKILSADKLSSESWTRFQSEAKALARLHHPGVVGIHNMGIDDGTCPYYVMDLLQGQSLAQLVKKQHRLSIKQTLEIFIQLTDALDAAHQQGIVHRDIKPSNVMILQENGKLNAKLVDFGIARLSNRGMGGSFNSQNQTAAGTVFGTPYYMSPEQSLGQGVDHRTDIYSLGCALFEALTGVPPLCGANAIETIMMHQTKDAPSLRSVYPEGDFPDALEASVAKMLRKKVETRYQSMKQVGHDLMRVNEGKSIGFTKTNHSFIDEDDDEQALPEPVENSKDLAVKKVMPFMVLAGACTAVVAILAAGIFAFNGISKMFPVEKSSPLVEKEPTGNDAAMMTQSPDLAELKRHMKSHDQFVALARNSKGETVRRFTFPEFYIGYLKVGDNKPIKAEHIIDAPLKAKNYLYMQCVCTPFPAVCEKFGTDNINGLEVVTFQPEAVIPMLKKWTALEHLSFYNSLEREEGIDTSTLQKEHMAMLDQLHGLKSLGLSGETVTGKPEEVQFCGADIINLKLLSSINSLMLKEIKDIQPLLGAIAKHPNIKELTLNNLDIKDADLKLLTNAQSLQTLRILQCTNITPGAANALSQMKGLKHLYIDRPWNPEAQAKVLAQVPVYAYEDYKKGRFH